MEAGYLAHLIGSWRTTMHRNPVSCREEVEESFPYLTRYLGGVRVSRIVEDIT